MELLKKNILIREVSSFQGGKCMVFVNLESCICVLERCPLFRDVLHDGVLLYTQSSYMYMPMTNTSCMLN